MHNKHVHLSSGEVRFIRWGLSSFLTPAIQSIAQKINTIVAGLHWLITRPKDMPAAGACSVFVIVIKRIDNPTASAPKIIRLVVPFKNNISKEMLVDIK